MKVYQAIIAVQKDLAHTGIAKSRENRQQGFRFRGIDEVQNAMAPLLAKHGLAIIPKVTSRECTERPTARGGIMYNVVLTVDYHMVCAEDGSTHVATTVGEAMDNADKATNKALSAAYKYLVLQAFCVPLEGQPDADADPEPEPASPGPCSAAQAQQIVELATQTGVDLTALLKHYKSNSIQEMTATAADNAIATLQKRLEK